MGFLDLGNLSDVTEKKLLAEGRYPLLVEQAKLKHNDGSGKDNILVILSIEGELNAANVMHNLALPHKDDEDTSKQFKLLQIKRFLVQFKISFDGGVNTEAFPGARATGNLTIEEYDGKRANKLVLDPMPQV